MKKKVLLFSLVLIIGLILRLLLIKQREIIIDESIYLLMARKLSLWEIVTLQFWVKDHGIIYYLLLKLCFVFYDGIKFIRIINLLLYIVSCIIVLLVSKKNRLEVFGLFFITLISFNSYFIYTNSMVTPFNLVSFLGLISIMSLINYFLSVGINYRSLAVFVITSILGFYSDYSFIFMYVIYISFVAVSLLLKKHVKTRALAKALTLHVIFVLPGVIQFLANLNRINYLFPSFKYKVQGLSLFFFDLADVLIFRQRSSWSFLFVLVLLFMSAYWMRTQRKTPLQFILIASLVSFMSLYICLYILLISLSFSLFVERSFWYFFYILFLIISLNAELFNRVKMRACNYLLFTLIVLCSIVRIPGFSDYTRFFSFHPIAFNTFQYSSLINGIETNVNIKDSNKLVFIDLNYSYWFYPMRDYYLNPQFSVSKSHAILTKKEYYVVRNLIQFENLVKKESNLVLLLMQSDLVSLKSDLRFAHILNKSKIFVADNSKNKILYRTTSFTYLPPAL